MFVVYSMYVIGTLFWLSEKAKSFQDVLENQYQVPTYAIFILLAVATIVVGLILGGVSDYLSINFSHHMFLIMLSVTVMVTRNKRVTTNLKCLNVELPTITIHILYV